MKAITVEFLLLFTSFVSMERIPNYQQVGSNFLQQYYTMYDNDFQRYAD